jgi:hypothetical protein
MEKLDIAEAWLWYDVVNSINCKRLPKTEKTWLKYQFFSAWSRALLDVISDGRPLLLNFHVADTFRVGSETARGAIIYNCLFKRDDGGKKIWSAVAVNSRALKR